MHPAKSALISHTKNIYVWETRFLYGERNKTFTWNIQGFTANNQSKGKIIVKKYYMKLKEKSEYLTIRYAYFAKFDQLRDDL